MNHQDFTQHFILALQQLSISDYAHAMICVEPIYEKEKWTSQTYDEMMRLQILPRKQKLPFDEVVKRFTFWEGYYPCWIELSVVGGSVHLKTSLRMRKAGHNPQPLHPFRVVRCADNR